MTEFVVEEGDCFAPLLLLMTPENGTLEASIMLTVTAISAEGKGASENHTYIIFLLLAVKKHCRGGDGGGGG